MAVLKEVEKALKTEKAYLLSQRRRLEENPTNIDTSKTRLVDAYINELRELTTTEYDHVVHHRPSKANIMGLADGMSRMPGRYPQSAVSEDLERMNMALASFLTRQIPNRELLNFFRGLQTALKVQPVVCSYCLSKWCRHSRPLDIRSNPNFRVEMTDHQPTEGILDRSILRASGYVERSPFHHSSPY